MDASERAPDGRAVTSSVPGGWRTLGHDGSRAYLLRALDGGRLAHAFLFIGPPAVGRMSLALDLARAVNCDAGIGARPCGRCRQCERITRMIHADVRVIDPDTPIESERARPGDDERARRVIRKGHIDDLQHRASLKPFEGRSHVFIIDGAELMQAAAANALLKTLEEPESQVLIVLIAATPGALPETIVSRCQSVNLRPVPADLIERHLVEVEGAEPATAAMLARAAQGRPGWAIAAMHDPTVVDARRQSIVRALDVLAGGLEERFRYARTLATAHRKDRAAVSREMGVWLSLWRDVLLSRNDLGDAIANTDFRAEITALSGVIDPPEAASAARAVRATEAALVRNAATPLVFDVLMLDLPFVGPGVLPDRSVDQGGEPDAEPESAV